MNNREIAHKFVHKDYGQNGGRTGSNFFSDEQDQALYSYGRHFMVACHLDPKKFKGFQMAVTTQTYSPITGRHVRLLNFAASHVSRLRCHDPSVFLTPLEALTPIRHK